MAESHWREQLRPIFERWDKGLWPGDTLSHGIARELSDAAFIERMENGNWRITEGGVAYLLYGGPDFTAEEAEAMRRDFDARFIGPEGGMRDAD